MVYFAANGTERATMAMHCITQELGPCFVVREEESNRDSELSISHATS
jgi:hypothetical protein